MNFVASTLRKGAPASFASRREIGQPSRLARFGRQLVFIQIDAAAGLRIGRQARRGLIGEEDLRALCVRGQPFTAAARPGATLRQVELDRASGGARSAFACARRASVLSHVQVAAGFEEDPRAGARDRVARVRDVEWYEFSGSLRPAFDFRVPCRPRERSMYDSSAGHDADNVDGVAAPFVEIVVFAPVRRPAGRVFSKRQFLFEDYVVEMFRAGQKARRIVPPDAMF